MSVSIISHSIKCHFDHMSFDQVSIRSSVIRSSVNSIICHSIICHSIKCHSTSLCRLIKCQFDICHAIKCRFDQVIRMFIIIAADMAIVAVCLGWNFVQNTTICLHTILIVFARRGKRTRRFCTWLNTITEMGKRPQCSGQISR